MDIRRYMPMNFEIGRDTVTYLPEKQPKKITGTRLSSILGRNQYSTSFQAWCEITRLYEKPFVDSIYTKAGKEIEKAQIRYIKDLYGSSVVSPTDIYGEDYFMKTYGDFFPENPIFGGMWDIQRKTNNETDIIFECKTTGIKHRSEWEKDIPEHYALQAALYAWLSHTDKVVMVASFLNYQDYKNPQYYKPDRLNTMITGFRVSDRYPDFEKEQIKKAEDWYMQYVGGGISPRYDTSRDSEYLAALHQIQKEHNSI
jgi:predicted phage-related endonuclease